MRSRRHLVALAVAALVWLAPAGLAQASGSVGKLLKKYQPVLVLHPDELFHPTGVEAFVHDSSLEAATVPGTWMIVDPRSADSLRPAARPFGASTSGPASPEPRSATSPATRRGRRTSPA